MVFLLHVLDGHLYSNNHSLGWSYHVCSFVHCLYSSATIDVGTCMVGRYIWVEHCCHVASHVFVDHLSSGDQFDCTNMDETDSDSSMVYASGTTHRLCCDLRRLLVYSSNSSCLVGLASLVLSLLVVPPWCWSCQSRWFASGAKHKHCSQQKIWHARFGILKHL